MSAVRDFALCLLQSNSPGKALALFREHKSWCALYHGAASSDFCESLRLEAICLRESGDTIKSEEAFRGLLAKQKECIEISEHEIPSALGGLAKTLELVGKLEEALLFTEQALAHRSEYEGLDTWWTNSERLDLARILHKLGRHPEARALLHELQLSMGRRDDPSEKDRLLIHEATDLSQIVDGAINSKS